MVTTGGAGVRLSISVTSKPKVIPSRASVPDSESFLSRNTTNGCCFFPLLEVEEGVVVLTEVGVDSKGVVDVVDV